MPPNVWGHISAVVLIAVLLLALARPEHRTQAGPAASGEEETLLAIDGMTCSHCAATVKRGLEELPGVDTANVSLADGKAIVRGRGNDIDLLRKTIADLGYKIVPGKEGEG